MIREAIFQRNPFDLESVDPSSTVHVRFVSSSARFLYKVTGHPIRCCPECGYWTDVPDVKACPNDSDRLKRERWAKSHDSLEGVI